MHKKVQGVNDCPGFWSLEDYDILILPSITVSFYEARKLSALHEERHLVLLNLLKNKNSRIIFVMSSELDAEIIKYRLDVYKKAYDDPTADERLILLSADDTSNRPLTEKILENDGLIKKIQGHLRKKEKSIMLSYICTDRDLELRNKIGIPQWFGSSAQEWGTKSGSRQIFKESGVPIAEGLMNAVYTVPKVEKAVLQLLHSTHARRIIFKTDDGSGGYGNLVLDFSEDSNGENFDGALNKALEKADSNLQQFTDYVEQSGAIVEEMMDPVSAENKQTTPSVQMYIHSENEVQILSSHEQVVDECIYLGCRYPANKPYLDIITKYAESVGKSLAQKGVRGFLGVDFLANQTGVEADSEWDIIALEINLRLCATTFAYFLLLTVVKEEEVAKKCYVMLDELHMNSKVKNFKQLDAELSQKGMAFDSKTGKGVMLATSSCLASSHEVSVLIIADSRSEVDELLEDFLTEFADEEERTHFSHSRSNSPVGSTRLGNEAEKEKGGEMGEKTRVPSPRFNEQGVALAV